MGELSRVASDSLGLSAFMCGPRGLRLPASFPSLEKKGWEGEFTLRSDP